MRNALPGHDPHTVGRTLAGHLNYFKTVTDRLESQGQLKDQNLDIYAFHLIALL